MKCSCNVVPRIEAATPVQKDGKTYWNQRFKCINPKCSYYNKVIAERFINIFNEKEKEEISYIK